MSEIRLEMQAAYARVGLHAEVDMGCTRRTVSVASRALVVAWCAQGFACMRCSLSFGGCPLVEASVAVGEGVARVSFDQAIGTHMPFGASSDTCSFRLGSASRAGFSRARMSLSAIWRKERLFCRSCRGRIIRSTYWLAL